MSEEEIKDVFAQNLKMYCDMHNLSQVEFSEAIGSSQQAISLWMTGQRFPRYRTIDKICDFFNISRSDLLEKRHEYYEGDTAAAMQEVFEGRDDLRLLFDAAKDLPPEQVQMVAQMIQGLKKTDN